jgi:hypothetical protein
MMRWLNELADHYRDELVARCSGSQPEATWFRVAATLALLCFVTLIGWIALFGIAIAREVEFALGLLVGADPMWLADLRGALNETWRQLFWVGESL